ncbi:MAG: efflux RND transporter periplasmic adaptor subunit [Pseudomonadales bacterium]
MSYTSRSLNPPKLLCAAATLLTLSTVFACQEQTVVNHAEPITKPIAVSVVELRRKPWAPTIFAFGQFESAAKAEVGVDFPGVVLSVGFEEGQHVTAGATLIKLDDRKQKLRMQKALAQLASVKAKLEQTQTSYRRYQALGDKQAVSRDQLKRARAEFETARGEYNAALAAEALARHELKETSVKSPVEGIVIKRTVEPGQTVAAGTPLAQIQAIHTLRMVTYVTEQEVNLLQIGAPLRVSSPGVPGRDYTGHIEMIGSSADGDTGNFVLKLAVSNVDGLLKEGMSARAELSGVHHANVLLIPRSALVDRGQRRVVYKAVQDQAIEVEPVLGVSDGPWIPVTSGLAPGDLLIVDGLELIIGGVAVTINGAGEGDLG